VHSVQQIIYLHLIYNRDMGSKVVQLNTGAEMPAIGFGTWQMHTKEVREAVTEALKTGYRLIDTARIYRNEKNVGQAIQESDIPRENVFITTKLWNHSQGYGRALKAFEASTQRLGLEYIDLYLIHWPVTGKREDSWRALEELYKSGQAKAIGVSNYTVRHLKQLLTNSSIVPAVNQVEFHPFLYKEHIELLDFCKQHKIIVEAYSPLARGRGLDNPIVADIAKNHNKSVAQIFLGWAIQHGTVPLPKSANRERIAENYEVFDCALSDAEMQSINNLSDGVHTGWNPNAVE
jgi:diketogulonate reductase-like aldo/keto reductase